MPTAAEAECDRLLNQANLPPRWLPQHVPDHLKELAAEVQEIDTAAEILEVDDVEAIIDLVYNISAEVVRKVVVTTPRDTHFRAKTALARGSGNCVAYHELAAGYLSALELGSLAMGQWSCTASRVGHASSGLLVGNYAVEFDAYRSANQSPMSAPSTVTYEQVAHPIKRLAWQNAAADQRPVICDIMADGTDMEWLLRDEDQVPLPQPFGTAIVAPAASAILMYSAMAVQHGGEKFESAQRVLADYTPSFAVEKIEKA